MKEIKWLGNSYKDILSFPKEAKKELGFNLDRVQRGEEPIDWKPMKSIGIGVKEIRIHIGDEYRVIYLASYPEAVYILHAFKKKTRRTAKNDINLAKERLKMVKSKRR